MTSGPRQSSGSHKRKASSADAASRKKPGRSGDEHRRRDRRSSLKTCPDCCQEISYSNFARHMREKHSAGHPVEEAPNGQRAGANHPQPPFDCPGCENSYTRRCSLRRHQTKTGHSESSPTSSERTLEIPTDVRSPSFDSDTDVGSPEYSRKLRLEDFFESRTAFNESFTPAFTHTEMEHQQHCGFQETDGYGTTYPQYTSSALWGIHNFAHVVGSQGPCLSAPATTGAEDHPSNAVGVPHQFHAEVYLRSSSYSHGEVMYPACDPTQVMYETTPVDSSSNNAWPYYAPFSRF